MTRGALAAAVLLIAPLAADAQSYRCVGKDGKRYYGQIVPQECMGLPVEQLNAQGMVIGRIDPEGSEKERLAKEAAEVKKRQNDAAARETARRNRALLATYSSERDIDEARTRALAANNKQVREAEERLEAVRKRQSGFQKELEFYSGKNKPPAKLLDDIKNVELDLKLQEGAVDAKKREVEGINAKYDEDRRRYRELNNPKADAERPSEDVKKRAAKSAESTKASSSGSR